MPEPTVKGLAMVDHIISKRHGDIDPAIYAFTPDHRLEDNECNCTYFPAGTTLKVTRIPGIGDPITVTVKEQLKGLKGNQLTLNYRNATKLGLDVDINNTKGGPTDVVLAAKID